MCIQSAPRWQPCFRKIQPEAGTRMQMRKGGLTRSVESQRSCSSFQPIRASRFMTQPQAYANRSRISHAPRQTERGAFWVLKSTYKCVSIRVFKTLPCLLPTRFLLRFFCFSVLFYSPLLMQRNAKVRLGVNGHKPRSLKIVACWVILHKCMGVESVNKHIYWIKLISKRNLGLSCMIKNVQLWKLYYGVNVFWKCLLCSYHIFYLITNK